MYSFENSSATAGGIRILLVVSRSFAGIRSFAVLIHPARDVGIALCEMLAPGTIGRCPGRHCFHTTEKDWLCWLKCPWRSLTFCKEKNNRRKKTTAAGYRGRRCRFPAGLSAGMPCGTCMPQPSGTPPLPGASPRSFFPGTALSLYHDQRHHYRQHALRARL
jgi:hypothetical protein